MSRALWALSWVPVAVTFTQIGGQIIWIHGRSMQPALNPDSSLGAHDLVVLKKWGLRQPQSIKKGDVVAFSSPLDPDRVLIKRVLACQGETIAPRPTSEYPEAEVKIPMDHFWVEGDNIHSIDSNKFGPISRGLVLGKAVHVLYPLSRWGPVPSGGRLPVETSA